MWVSKATLRLLARAEEAVVELRERLAGNTLANNHLTIENTRLRADLDWFKHRLTQVERERGQLIAAAIGVKIAVPEFVPTYRPDEALNTLNDPFADLGPVGDEMPSQVNYSMLPGFRPAAQG